MSQEYTTNKKALRLLRGKKTGNAFPKLEPGQPYYDKDRNFLYVG